MIIYAQVFKYEDYNKQIESEKSMTSTASIDSYKLHRSPSASNNSLPLTITNLHQMDLKNKSSSIVESSNIKRGLQLLAFYLKRRSQASLLESMNLIKQKQCIILKYKILTGATKKIMKRMYMQTLKQAYETLRTYTSPPSYLSLKSSLSKRTEQDIKYSLESTFVMDSIIGSSQIEKYNKFVCCHCRKQFECKPTASKQLVITNLPYLQYNLKQPNHIPFGIFQQTQKIPQKLINNLPDLLLTSIGDQSCQFMNLQISQSLFKQKLSKLIPTLPLKEVVSFKQQPGSINDKLQSNPLQSVSNISISLTNNAVDNFKPQMEMSIIQKLMTQNQIVSSVQQNIESQLFLIPEVNTPKLQQSFVLPINYENKDLFSISIQNNKNNNNNYLFIDTINQNPIPVPKTKQTFKVTDSEIKKHILQFRRKSLPQEIKVYNTKMAQQITAKQRKHKLSVQCNPTFFQTAYYFDN